MRDVDNNHHLVPDDELCDLVDVAVLISAISAASEVINQYNSWQQNRDQVREHSDSSIASIRRDLLRFADLVELAQHALAGITASLELCIKLINDADPEILDQIPFLTGYKARVRWRDRPRYRGAVGNVVYNLGIVLQTLDEAAEVVSRVVPPSSREDLLHSARVSFTEHQVIADTLEALAQPDTTFGGAVNLVRDLLKTAGSYLDTLRSDALGFGAAKESTT